MSDKSFVTMEQHACAACGTPYDTGALLLDRRMREMFDRKTVTRVAGLCEQCTKMRDDGYIALVAIEESLSERLPSGNYRPDKVYRTGAIAHVRGEAWPNIFNVPTPPDGFAFVPQDVIDLLDKMRARSEQQP